MALPSPIDPLSRRIRSAILWVLPLFCLSCALLLPSPVHAATPGQVNLMRNATSSFDSYTSGATASQRTWIDSHYSSMRGYAPYFNQALSWAPPADFYRDLYAIYHEDEAMISQHPDWILKDSSGHRLYIPWDCNGSYCSQYAADVGNPEFRHWWIEEAKAELAKGYKGIFIDDVNMTMNVGNAAGNDVAPVDPRTGSPMSETTWRRYVAEFTEEIRNAMPSADIVHNTAWWEDQSDPYVQREVKSADTIELERGFSDAGLTGGFGRFGYRTLLAHVEWLHSLGKSVILEPYLSNSAEREFELASYFLINNSTDMISSDFETDPGDYWEGWSTNLGAAVGPRYEWHGLLRRDFSGGVVLTNAPEGATTTVALGGTYETLEGAEVSSVTLKGRQGVVLTSPKFSAPEGEAPTGPETEPPAEGTEGEAEPEPQPESEPEAPVAGEGSTEAPATSVGTEPASTPPAASTPPTSAPIAATVETAADGTTTISGRSAEAGVDVTIVLQQRGAGGWVKSRVIHVASKRHGRFVKRLGGLAPGSYRVSAESRNASVSLDDRSFVVA